MLLVKEKVKGSSPSFFCPKKAFCPFLQEALRENKRIKAENEKLREIFEFATVEFEKRNKKIVSLEENVNTANAMIKKLRGENERLQKGIEELMAKNNLLNRMVFGKKKEKETTRPCIRIIKKRGGALGHTGHGRKIPKNLPEKEEIVDLPEEEKFCSFCGKPLIQIELEEVSSEVCVEKKYYLKRIKRKVYKKSCSCPNLIITAPAPPKIIPKGKFSTSFWVDVLINKYKNHLPVERQIS